MTAEIIHRVQPGSENIILGWEIGREGRKRFAGTAVFNDSGTLWPKPKPPGSSCHHPTLKFPFCG
jgi:hypothetical protein